MLMGVLFSDYFHASEFTGEHLAPLATAHPIAIAIAAAGSLHCPDVPFTHIQRPPGHDVPVDVLLWRPGLPGANGTFVVHLAQPPSVPTLVRLNPATPTPAMTTAHELGHVMDHLLKVRLIGPSHVSRHQDLFASEALHPLLRPWWQAVTASALYPRLSAAPPAGPVRDSSSTYGLPDNSPSECFACSYAQLVATETRNEPLLQDLRTLQARRTPRYWPDQEFVPIAAALRALFVTLGWSQP